MTRITTTAGGVVVSPQGQILVVNQNSLSWSLPKGHIEANEEILAAAKREIHEESGITQLTLIKKLGSYERYKISKSGDDDTSELKRMTFFLFTTDQIDLKPIDPDNPEARWVDIDSVSQLLTHFKDKAFFESIQHDVQHWIQSEIFGLLSVTTTIDAYSTAEKLSRLILEKKLGACVQISGPIQSHYPWEGRLEQNEEWVLTIKTLFKLWPKLDAFIKANHPYKIPQLTATRLTNVNESYRQWVWDHLHNEASTR